MNICSQSLKEGVDFVGWERSSQKRMKIGEIPNRELERTMWVTWRGLHVASGFLFLVFSSAAHLTKTCRLRPKWRIAAERRYWHRHIESPATGRRRWSRRRQVVRHNICSFQPQFQHHLHRFAWLTLHTSVPLDADRNNTMILCAMAGNFRPLATTHSISQPW